MKGWGANPDEHDFDSFEDYALWYLMEELCVFSKVRFQEIERSDDGRTFLCQYKRDCWDHHKTIVEVWIENGVYHGVTLDRLEKYQHLLEEEQV